MRKIILIFLSILICIGICGCDTVERPDLPETDTVNGIEATEVFDETNSETENDTEETTDIPNENYQITGTVDKNFGSLLRIVSESQSYIIYVNDDIKDSVANLTYGDEVTVYYDGNIIEEMAISEIKNVYEIVLVAANNNAMHANFYSNTDVVENIIFEDQYLTGKLVYKITDTVLVLELRSYVLVDKLGEYVCVITDKDYEFCLGDDIQLRFSVAEKPIFSDNYTRIIPDNISEAILDAKPIIYFYPESPMVCSAKVELDGKLTCTYPEHGNEGWKNFTAYPDGTLIFPDGKEYYALYWEGIQNTKFDFSCGFCVRGEDTVEFLEWALAEQGLTRREANEFIMYWLPRMQENKYNVISFQTSAYTDTAVLNITPAPDSMLRVFMTYYPSSVEVDIEPQTFEPFIRDGFTVVEWGGSELEKP